MNKHSRSLRRASAVGIIAAAGACLTVPALAANDMASLSWLAGVWQTSVTNGAQTEYVYVPTTNGVMISTMFAVKNGEPTRYELRVIKVEGDKVLFRENAFKPDLSPGAPVPERPLESTDATHINFVDMKVTRVSENEIKMALTTHGGAQPMTRDIELHRVFRFVETKKK